MGVQWSASRPGRFVAAERVRGACLVGYADPSSDMDALDMENVSPYRESNLYSSVG
jgi:hypothetical protein